MSKTSPEINIRVIDSEKSLLTLLESISSLVVDPPSLYIDLEGNALGRHGSISILTLHIAPTKKTYLIDIHSLKEAAFSTTTAIVFDIRNDSDALFSLFQISVDGIKDVQLMELATRNGSWRFVSSLVECIKQDSPISPAAAAEWRGTKEPCRRLFAPEKSGRFEVFNKRPLNLEIIQYCENDVSILPALYGVYNDKLRQDSQAFWRVQVREDTKDRIKLSQSAGYNGKSKSMALGWDDHLLEDCMDSWSDDIMMEAMDSTYVLNENDDWVLAERDGLNDFFG
ncbi:hypothetical protein VE00_02830 [Pseudogymnoascus sp. WSF 3629]|nr:hypothetical protein VE00_02830 [Pseudogymnoascus sp. WSF 3629]